MLCVVQIFICDNDVCDFKAKDTYHARCFELEKLKRESANQKDCERAEMKMKRARAFTFTSFMMSINKIFSQDMSCILS